MAITVRKSVFETNISSSHSITIKNGGEWDNIGPGENGVIIVQGDEFGWGYEEYNYAYAKASYCATACQYDKYTRTELLKKVIEDYTGYPTEIYSDGYIDHQSSDVADEIFESEENLRNFIFNKASVLIIDNDNH